MKAGPGALNEIQIEKKTILCSGATRVTTYLPLPREQQLYHAVLGLVVQSISESLAGVIQSREL